MKKNHINITARMLHFARWSRNRYAAFCSIGRQVIIATVCKSIADASLKKQLNGLNISDNDSCEENSYLSCFDVDDGPDVPLISSKEILIRQLLSSVAASTEVASFVTSIHIKPYKPIHIDV